MGWMDNTVWGTGFGSYGLKHRCERDLSYDPVVQGYVSNGEFIMAAILAGRRVHCDPAEAARVGFHPCINVVITGNSPTSIRAAKRLLALFRKCDTQKPLFLEKSVDDTRELITKSTGVPPRMATTFDSFMAQSTDWQRAFSFDTHIFRFWNVEDKDAVRALLEVLYAKGVSHLRDVILAHVVCATYACSSPCHRQRMMYNNGMKRRTAKRKLEWWHKAPLGPVHGPVQMP